MSPLRAALLALLALSTAVSRAQVAAPTTGVLTRTLMVESRYGRGTIFSIDVDGREYWITAKHVLTGAEHPPYGNIKDKSISLSLLNPLAEGETWVKIDFSVIDTGKDVDIAVLAPGELLLNGPPDNVLPDNKGILLGGDCVFLGFPYGGSWRAKFGGEKSFWMPFVKHCNVSAMPSGEPRIWVLDGINNHGFSGGPVVYKTGLEQRMFAVISGYHAEPAEIVSSAVIKHSSQTKRKLQVNVNSGFIIAYDIQYAIDAIRSNPIGPLRKHQ